MKTKQAKPMAVRVRPANPCRLTADVFEPERPLSNADRLALYLYKRDLLESSCSAARLEVPL